jgi:hypothetical protein
MTWAASGSRAAKIVHQAGTANMRVALSNNGPAPVKVEYAIYGGAPGATLTLEVGNGVVVHSQEVINLTVAVGKSAKGEFQVVDLLP